MYTSDWFSLSRFDIVVIVGILLVVFAFAWLMGPVFDLIGKHWMRFENAGVDRWNKYLKRRHLKSLRRR